MAPDRSPVTLLLVDDSEANRFLLAEVLRQAGFAVVEASCGAEALRRAGDDPDLVILDVNLPDMTGFDVCRKIKATPQTAPIPVLHLTGAYLKSEDVTHGLENGADAYLIKPVEPAELIAHIKALLRIRRAEHEARAAARQWQATFDAIPEAVWMVGPRGDVLRCNRAMAQLLGKPPADVLGRSAGDFLPGMTVAADAPPPPGGPEARQRRVAELHVGGRWFRLTEDAVVEEDGARTGTIQVWADVTESKRTEEEIWKLNTELERRVRQRTAELEAANRELEAFCYSVSHDLRAPARGVLGLSRILLGEYGPKLPPEAQRYLKLLDDNSRQMGHLIDDLLTFSRLSRQPLKKTSVAVAGLVRRCFEELDAQRQGRDVEVVLGDLPACEADPALLKQVWCNLLGNALKYTAKQEAPRIEVGCKEDGGERVYYVRDNGVGFDMRYAGKLFGVFQRLHRAEDYEGTGVGLAVVQRIVHRHGGRVWAEAAVNRGATFSFTLP